MPITPGLYGATMFPVMVNYVHQNLNHLNFKVYYNHTASAFYIQSYVASSMHVSVDMNVALVSQDATNYTSTSVIYTRIATYSGGSGPITFADSVPEGIYDLYVVGYGKTMLSPYPEAGNTSCTSETEVVKLTANGEDLTFIDFEGHYPYDVSEKVYVHGIINETVGQTEADCSFIGFYLIDNSGTIAGNKVTFGHNDLPQFSDGTCPGVACITVTNIDDRAGIAGKVLKPNPSNAENCVAGFRIYIEDENTEEDEITISIGLTNCSDGYTAGTVYAYFLGNAIHYNYQTPRKSNGGYYIERTIRSNTVFDGAVYTFSERPQSNLDMWPPANRWITVDFVYNLAVDSGTVVVGPGFASMSIGNSNSYDFSATPVSELTPMILVTKKKGTKPMKVYVDYMYYGNNV